EDGTRSAALRRTLAHPRADVRIAGLRFGARGALTADARATVERMASEDPLTGLLNRARFMSRLQHEMRRAGRHGRPLSVIVLDIDSFRRINDGHGHAAGDQALKRLAQVMRGLQRDTDALGRMGGEEFALLLPETDLEGAGTVAERLREQVQAVRLSRRGARIDFTVSLGVAQFGHGESAEHLLARADEGLHEAKRAGRNRTIALGAARRETVRTG
ncbi:MAG: GGDEF domain-containing protein, partial [Burkholderiales bacterium]